jgi:hypothetical protein
VTRINPREVSLIGNQDNAAIEQSNQKAADPPCQLKPSASVRRIDRRDKATHPPAVAVAPNDNLTRLSLISKNSFDLLIAPPSMSTITKTNRISVIKLPRSSKSFVKPHPTTSIVNVKLLPRQSQHSDLNVSRKSQRRASSVSVSRIKRSLSAEQS